MPERIFSHDGKDVTIDGDPLRVVHPTEQSVKITDGTDIADVELLNTILDNINGKKGLITKSELYGRVSDLSSFPLPCIALTADAITTSYYPLRVVSHLTGFNGITWDRLRSDTITKTIVVTDLDTYKLHQEKQYVASHLFSAVATTAVVYLRIMPHATTKCHFGYIVQSDGECKIEVIEGTTYNEDGEAVEGFNRHRESTETTDQLVYHTPTINVLGTDILSVNLLGSAGKFTGSGDRVSSSDWHLKPSTDILLKVTNISTDNSEIVIKFNFME
nr:MAG: DUF6143 containing protein [uncultured archaeon]